VERERRHLARATPHWHAPQVAKTAAGAFSFSTNEDGQTCSLLRTSKAWEIGQALEVGVITMRADTKV